MADSKPYVTVQCDPVAERAAWILSGVHKDVLQSRDKTLKYFLQLQLQKRFYASLDKI